MNIIVIPFHDWNKALKEGFRTRDVHFIKAFENNSFIEKILIINRPNTCIENVVKGYKKEKLGKKIYSYKTFSLYQYSEKIFIIDWVSIDVIGQLSKNLKWFILNYTNKNYLDFIHKSIEYLSFSDYIFVNQNIFASKVINHLKPTSSIFDAWDNFLLFSRYKGIKKILKKQYEELVNYDLVITNSEKNEKNLKSKFKLEQVQVIRNGVSDSFTDDSVEKRIPEDMAKISRPIVGFGGKISHLFNYDLFNYLAENNPHLSFVILGVILDKTVFEKIKKYKNVHYLSDKHYSVYPDYVKAFDICIAPYLVGDKDHGGDSIKAYEYLSLNKKVVATIGNGFEKLEDYLYLTNEKEVFSEILRDEENNKKVFPAQEYHWNKKVSELIEVLKKIK